MVIYTVGNRNITIEAILSAFAGSYERLKEARFGAQAITYYPKKFEVYAVLAKWGKDTEPYSKS